MSILQAEDMPPLYEHAPEVKKPQLESEIVRDLLPDVDLLQETTEESVETSPIVPSELAVPLQKPALSLPAIEGSQETGARFHIPDVAVEEELLQESGIHFYQTHDEHKAELQFEEVIKKTTPHIPLTIDKESAAEQSLSPQESTKLKQKGARHPEVERQSVSVTLDEDSSDCFLPEEKRITIPNVRTQTGISYRLKDPTITVKGYIPVELPTGSSVSCENGGSLTVDRSLQQPALQHGRFGIELKEEHTVPDLQQEKNTTVARTKTQAPHSYSLYADVKKGHTLSFDSEVASTRTPKEEKHAITAKALKHDPLFFSATPFSFEQSDEKLEPIATQKQFFEKGTTPPGKSNSFTFSPKLPSSGIHSDAPTLSQNPQVQQPQHRFTATRQPGVKEVFRTFEAFPNEPVSVSHYEDPNKHLGKLSYLYRQQYGELISSELPQEYYIPVDEVAEDAIPHSLPSEVVALQVIKPATEKRAYASSFFIRPESVIPGLSLPAHVEKAELLSYHAPVFTSSEELPVTHIEQEQSYDLGFAPDPQAITPSQATFCVLHALDRTELPDIFEKREALTTNGIYSHFTTPMAHQIVDLHYEQDTLSIPNEYVLPIAYRDDGDMQRTSISEIKQTLAYANTVADVVKELFPDSLGGETIHRELADPQHGEPHFTRVSAVTHKNPERINQTSRLTTYNLTRLPTPQDLNVENFVHELDTTVRILPRKDKEGYFFTVTLRPAPKAQMTRQNQNVVFIIDRTASILEPRFEAYKKGVYRALNYLSEGDTFNILIADSRIHYFEMQPVQATRATKRRARQFLQDFAFSSLRKKHLETYDLLYELDSFFPENKKHNTAVLITDGSNLLSLDKRKSSLEKVLKKNQRAITLHTATAARGNNTPMLDILSTFHSGEFTYSPTLVAFPRKLARLVKKTNTLLINSMHITPLNEDPTFDVQIYQSNDRLPHLYNGTPFTVYGAVNKLQDFEVIFQGKVGETFVHCPKTISFKNAKKGAPDLYKHFHVQKAYSCYEHYIEKRDPEYLKEAKRLLQKYRLPCAARRKSTFNK